jgi:Ca-activated chloride channel homolog
VNAWLESTFGFVLVDPLLLALVPTVALATWTWRARVRPSALRVGALDALRTVEPTAPLPRGGRARIAGLAGFVRALGVVLIAIALARPVERVPRPVVERGIDIAVCLDVSSSMTERDLDPGRTRLEVAVDTAQNFARARTDDRIALLRFARFVDVVTPPTLDESALAAALGTLRTVRAESDEDATGIGLAVGRATELLVSRGAPSRVVVLLSDGIENVAVDGGPGVTPRDAARLARARGVRVHTIVVGSGGPDVQLEERDLLDLAAHTRGSFFRANDRAGLEAAFAAIDRLERVELTSPRFDLRERYAAFVVAGLVLMGIARVLATTVLEVRP